MIDQTRKFYFSPDDTGLVQVITDFVKMATKQILVADYSFNLGPLVDVLIAKHNGGVEVRLVLDKSQAAGKSEIPEVQALKAAGVPMVVGTSDKHKIMHNKFMVIDGEWVEAGSLNYTGTAFLEDNFFFTEHNPEMAQQFAKIFSNIEAWISQNEPQ